MQVLSLQSSVFSPHNSRFLIPLLAYLLVIKMLENYFFYNPTTERAKNCRPLRWDTDKEANLRHIRCPYVCTVHNYCLQAQSDNEFIDHFHTCHICHTRSQWLWLTSLMLSTLFRITAHKSVLRYMTPYWHSDAMRYMSRVVFRYANLTLYKCQCEMSLPACQWSEAIDATIEKIFFPIVPHYIL